jgi:hypothetical protein
MSIASWLTRSKQESFMIQELIQEALYARGEKSKDLIRQIVSHPDEALEFALSVLGTAGTARWRLATEIIHAIGYPRNVPGIPVLIAGVGDRNFVAWQEAVDALVEMGPDVVVPYLIRHMLVRKLYVSWGSEVESMCEMLWLIEDRTYLLRCGPVISSILNIGDIPPEYLDKEFMLDALEAIGPECAVYALPTLIQFAQKEGTSEQGMQARHLMSSFSQEDQAPYVLVLASLEEMTAPNASN